MKWKSWLLKSRACFVWGWHWLVFFFCRIMFTALFYLWYSPLTHCVEKSQSLTYSLATVWLSKGGQLASVQHLCLCMYVCVCVWHPADNSTRWESWDDLGFHAPCLVLNLWPEVVTMKKILSESGIGIHNMHSSAYITSGRRQTVMVDFLLVQPQ